MELLVRLGGRRRGRPVGGGVRLGMWGLGVRDGSLWGREGNFGHILFVTEGRIYGKVVVTKD